MNRSHHGRDHPLPGPAHTPLDTKFSTHTLMHIHKHIYKMTEIVKWFWFAGKGWINRKGDWKTSYFSWYLKGDTVSNAHMQSSRQMLQKHHHHQNAEKAHGEQLLAMWHGLLLDLDSVPPVPVGTSGNKISPFLTVVGYSVCTSPRHSHVLQICESCTPSLLWSSSRSFAIFR